MHTLTPREKEKLKHDLSKLNTPGEILNYLQQTFDLSQPLGPVVQKPAFISGAIKAIELVKPEKKRPI